MTRARMRMVVGAAVVATVLATTSAQAATVRRLGSRSYSVAVRTPSAANLSVTRLTFTAGSFSSVPTAAPLRAALAGGGLMPATYLAAGRLFPARRATIDALVVVVNRRPAGALYPDRASYTLHVSGARLTHAPRVGEIANAFTPPGVLRIRPPDAICADHSGTLASRDVPAVLHLGAGFGFSSATVLTQGYAAACLRPVSPAFRRGVTAYDPCIPPPCGPLPASERAICVQPRTEVACPLGTR